MKSDGHRKRNGIHYTPPDLADFLSGQIWRHADSMAHGPIRILDPACGDGQLLESLARQIPPDREIEVCGCETDASAVMAAADRLNRLGHAQACIHQGDFLSLANARWARRFHIVITNPPYVRTQQLGRHRARQIARRFNLTGRVDLYQAFSVAITRIMVQGGVLGLLTSNRFMYVQAGSAMRAHLPACFELLSVFDLGDTGFFEAAVLPAIIIGRRSERGSTEPRCDFVRVSRCADRPPQGGRPGRSLLHEIARPNNDQAAYRHGDFRIERGCLERDRAGRRPWALSHRVNRRWMARIERWQEASFADVADIKVGIKTTADAVFIRDDWHRLDAEFQPEKALLKPLLTHHVADRWSAKTPSKMVLYPYRSDNARIPVDLKRYPRAARYLNQYRDRLSSRGYLIKAGRRWFELWVPHQPMVWPATKIVWPDICERPRFFLDRSGAVVNGDCYWIRLKQDQDPDWLYLMLAVANSAVAMQFYDYRFHNKLYAGRRRFMTQYVREFPLPAITRPVCQEIAQTTKQLLDLPPVGRRSVEAKLHQLVHQAFDLKPTYPSTMTP